jgi:sugar lactone lactonase YvrE
MTWTMLTDGLTVPEGPRWHAGRLWLSDFYSHRVLASDAGGAVEAVAEVPAQPSGLGWLPDGRLLVVSRRDRRVLRDDGAGLVEHADLSALATGPCNDMVVAPDGCAYVGNFGSDHHAGEPERDAVLVRVEPDGSVHPAAADLAFPNGSVVTDDRRTLVVAETRGRRLSAFDIGEDGRLSGRRVWADLAGGFPDGICLDAEGAVWYADPRNNEVVRVREGGEVLERRSTGAEGAFACMLGGSDRRTLYVCVCTGSGPAAAARQEGRVVHARG